ncbi:hypothetical protein ppKF707_3236 [Metapseudomonas furukawaii]|uniref:Uncharacterized protein n=1 Tax=Metapseudomonas furukawaii TaxID=1149133 RepID=A0AAD1FDB6_METFU|nr:hypothetical protein ppKF707_3236 [Pseudomonas furukawaii]BAU72011.1 hypothetical protein KF707C_3230 [Pseudomonas furukawaii]
MPGATPRFGSGEPATRTRIEHARRGENPCGRSRCAHPDAGRRKTLGSPVGAAIIRRFQTAGAARPFPPPFRGALQQARPVRLGRGVA